MPATGDCELIRDSFLSQPANALSSLAFVAVGLVILRSRPVIGILAIGVGCGSFLFHGPTPGWAEWAHDVTLTVLLAGLVLERHRWVLAAVITVFATAFALWPPITEPVAVAVAVVAAGYLGKRLWGQLSSWHGISLALLGSGLVLQSLSRPDGPLCSPESVVQGHALWHVLAAGALYVFARFDTTETATG